MKHVAASSVLVLCCAAACGDNQTPPPAHADYQAGAVQPLPCLPNLDGKIDANELAPHLGIKATYLVSPAGKERTVDVAGRTTADGKTEWPGYAVDYADDGALEIEASALAGKWYASSFAKLADPFVTPIDAGDRTEGVYTHDDTGFYLHGVASTAPDAPEGKTLLVYDAPVLLYQFPLVPGAAWKSEGVVKNGTFRGLPYAGKDTYEVKVDGAGLLGLPDFTLTQALRVRTLVTVAPAAGQTTTQRQVSFLFECLGEVTRVTSRTNETVENFTAATELRRLGLSP
jgi:hypothetical protein